jgi:hypothetical protein
VVHSTYGYQKENQKEVEESCPQEVAKGETSEEACSTRQKANEEKNRLKKDPSESSLRSQEVSCPQIRPSR